MTIRAKMDSCHIHVASQAGCQEMFKSAKDSYCFMVKERNSVYSLVSVSSTERVPVSIIDGATPYWQCIPAWTMQW